MKKLVSFLFVLSFLYSCSDVEGNLVGVSGRDTWYPDVLGPGKMPLGMVYIPSGAFQSGEDGEDIMGLHTARKKTVSVPAFYMDATEISNNEYRQFVHWVRDSIAREKLYARSPSEDAERWITVPDNFFKEPYRTMVDMGSDVQGGNTPFQLFMDSLNNVEVDKTFITMLANSNGKLVNNKMKPKALIKPILIGGQQYKPLSTEIKEKDQLGVVMSDKELQLIFQAYTGPFKGTAGSEPDVKTENKSTIKNLQGGRVENRKYFTLNWAEPLEYDDPEVAFLLSDMYYSKEESFYKRKEIDTRLLFFDYFWIDYKEAARRGKVVTKAIDSRVNFDYDGQTPANRREPLGKDAKTNDLHRATLFNDGKSTWVDETTNQAVARDDDGRINPEIDSTISSLNSVDNVRSTILENPGQDLDLGFTNSKGQHNAIRGHTDRSRFIIKERINVYPDTLCWVRDFTYANHTAMAQNYFWNTAYDNYPVVGVTWPQAKAFSVWRTQIFHSWLQSNGDLFVNDFRLPTESEWERAARGDLDMAEYPWGGPYIRNNSGCFLANFKPMRGRYFEDGGFYTVKVYSYNPNGFGLYCMAGNVAEWCSSAFDESAYEFETDMAPDYEYDAKDGDPTTKKRKVLRGGSWKDIGFYLMNSTRTFEYQDTAKSYIGFRNTMTHLGRGGKSIEQENGEEIQSDISIK